MQFTLATFTAVLIGLASAAPAVEEVKTTAATAIQVANLVFHGGPAQYTLAVPADGTVIPTNNNIAINIIDANDYNALSQCTFNWANGATPALQYSINTTNGNQSILVGPPTALVSVSCQGMCVPIYGMCYNTQGQWVGPCCNGFCAATRCRPWISGGN